MEHILGSVNTKDPKYFADLCKKNIEITKNDLAQVEGKELFLNHAMNAIAEAEKVQSMLLARLREWYGWYAPELVRQKQSPEEFIESVMQAKRTKESIGIDIDAVDKAALQELASAIQRIASLQDTQEKYVTELVQKIAPNLSEVATPLLAAKLIELAGSLKRMSTMSSSTIQLLGAEKALFRHMQTGAKSPKYGVIYHHKLLQSAKNKGKAARLISGKMLIAVRVDYFKGEKTLGKKLLKEIKEKLK